MFLVMFCMNISPLCKKINFYVNGVQLYMELVSVDKRTLYFRMLWDSGVGGCYV